MTTSDSTQPEDYTTLVDTREKNHNSLIIVVGVLALLVLGVFWLFIPDDNEVIELAPPLEQAEIDPIVRAQIEAAKQAPAAQQAAQGKAPKTTEMASFAAGEAVKSQNRTTVASQTSAVTAKPSNSLPPGDRARELIKTVKQGEQNLSMEQLFTEAGQLQKDGLATDAYLLYFYAARQGHGPSAFKLAEMNDPAYFSGGSDLLEKPDPMQAYKWYSVAAASQVDNAGERLNKLRGSVEAAASSGDPAAQRLLLNWK